MQEDRTVDFECVDGTIRACRWQQPSTAGRGAAGGRTTRPTAAENMMDKYFDEQVLSETRLRMREADETMRLSAEIKDMAEALLFFPPTTRTVSST